VALRVLPAAGGGLSWLLSGAVAAADVVHLLGGAGRAASAALLAARLQGKPACATDPGVAARGLWGALELRRLVQRLLPADLPPERLAEAYQELAARGAGAAA
jgi:hypothetical protein